MPVMDGYQAVAAMRQQGIKQPVVALTANAMKGYEQKVLAAGFSHYMTKPIDLDRLTELLAELLGGTYIEAAVNENSTDSMALNQAPNIVNAKLGVGPVYSTMAQQNKKFETIAKQFAKRLEDMLVQMQDCADKADYDSLAKHAHWLKGSGGTVGFNEFIGPARALEEAAKQSDAHGSHSNLAIISDIHSRISFDHNVDSSSTDGLKNVSQFPESAQVTPNQAQSIEPTDIHADNSKNVSGEPVTSALPMNNARFRGIVERYLPRLDEKLEEIQLAIEAEDFDELASLAHWLKGSGGNVGFDGFTELAASLESGAKTSNRPQIDEMFEAILRYSQRVRLGWELLEPLEKSA